MMMLAGTRRMGRKSDQLGFSVRTGGAARTFFDALSYSEQFSVATQRVFSRPSCPWPLPRRAHSARPRLDTPFPLISAWSCGSAESVLKPSSKPSAQIVLERGQLSVEQAIDLLSPSE